MMTRGACAGDDGRKRALRGRDGNASRAVESTRVRPHTATTDKRWLVRSGCPRERAACPMPAYDGNSPMKMLATGEANGLHT
jgi:hypothetical protein